VFNIPQRARESVSKACFGVHTRDHFLKMKPADSADALVNTADFRVGEQLGNR